MPSPLDVDDFGAIIRRARKKLSLSQATLGDRVGLCQSQVSAIECGHVADIPASLLDRLSKTLDVPLVELTEAAVSRATVHRASRGDNDNGNSDIAIEGAA